VNEGQNQVCSIQRSGKVHVGMGVTSPPGLAAPYRTQRIPWSTTRGFLRISGSSLGTLPVLPCNARRSWNHASVVSRMRKAAVV
jgi:hypothetical protein